MRTRTLVAGLIAAVGLCLPVLAAAQQPIAPPPAAEPAPPAYQPIPPASAVAVPAAFPPTRMRIGFNLVPTPTGSYTSGNGIGSVSGDLGFAFGLLPFFDYFLTPNIFLGFGPTYTFNVKASPSLPGAQAATQLDLLVRIGGQAPVSDVVQLYGYLTPGYSFFMPSDGDSAKGFVLGIHGGGMYTVSPTVFLNAELGYQLGYQKLDVGGQSFDVKDNLFQIALGGGIHI